MTIFPYATEQITQITLDIQTLLRRYLHPKNIPKTPHFRRYDCMSRVIINTELLEPWISRGEKNTRPDCEIWLVWIDSFEKCLKDTLFFDRIKIQLKLVQVKGGCLHGNFLQNCNRAKFPLNRGSGRKGYTFRSTPPTPITTGSTTFFVGNPKKNRAPKPPKRHPGCGVIQGIGYTTNCQVIHRDLFLQNLEVTFPTFEWGHLTIPKKA